MKTFLLSLAGAFAALILFVLFSFFVLAGMLSAATATEPQPDNLVLTLDLRESLPDQAPTSGLAALSGQPGFTTIITNLKAAGRDDSVKGVLIRASSFSVGSARAEELRAAIKDLRANGKFVIAHTQGNYGGSGPSALRAISAADEIWIQPGSDVFATGISLETEFLKGLFDNLSITPEIEALYEYKNAPNSYQEEGYTEPHREALLELAEDLWRISIRDIAEDRDMSAETVRTTLESGGLSADAFIAAGLADTLGWPEDAIDAAQARAGEAELIDAGAYLPPIVKAGAPIIAVVGGQGPIVTGPGEQDLFSGQSGFASDFIAASILEAGRNENVRALVFRVDSPGGSPTASDQIWRAIERVQEMDKPVIVSMGSVAASGGYYVSTGADEIVANETTLTGSIGIFGGKFAIAEGLSRIGVNIDNVTVGGEFAHAYGADTFTEGQRAEVREWLKRGYERFTGLVAEGRGMSVEEVHERARGRVWSGVDAHERGLVDTLGGFNTAVDRAKALADIDADQDVRLLYYPAQKQGFEALEDLFGASSETVRAAAVLSSVAGDERLIGMIEELSAIQSGELRAIAPLIRER